jgi:hypothetical protein
MGLRFSAAEKSINRAHDGAIFFESVPKLSHSGSCLYTGFLGYIPLSLDKFTKESHRRNSGIYLIPRFGVARDDVIDDKY